MTHCAAPFVTPAPWGDNLKHPWYGAHDTYQLAAAWLQACPDIADWGGSTGFFGSLLPATTKYRVVDGTLQNTDQVLADLRTYRAPSAGILLRHVLELNIDWSLILANALEAFQQRMVVVTFTGPAPASSLLKFKSGWPIHAFNVDELRRQMGVHLVRDAAIQTSHPEHVFYLEKGR